MSSLPTKIDEEGRKITVLSADLEGVRSQVSSLRSDLPIKGVGESAATKTEEPAARASSEPPREITPPQILSLPVRASISSTQKKYDQASEYFANLTKSKPDDARNWYYAALSRGLATRDWKGETEKLVTRRASIARRRASPRGRRSTRPSPT